MQWQSGIMTINLAYHAQRTPWTIRSGLAGKGPCFITRRKTRYPWSHPWSQAILFRY